MLHIEQILLFVYVSYIFIHSELRVNGSKVKITTELLDSCHKARSCLQRSYANSLSKSCLLCVVDLFCMYDIKAFSHDITLFWSTSM